MTQEDKELLLVDLSVRLPYGVFIRVYDNEINKPVELLSINPKRVKPLEIDDGYGENSSTYWNLEDVKPYLRPMSSMTKEELYEVQEILGKGVKIHDAFIYIVDSSINKFSYLELQAVFEWLNANHFDYRGLIERGLALEAPEGMYNIKNK